MTDDALFTVAPQHGLSFVAQVLEPLQIFLGQLLAFLNAQVEKVYLGPAAQELEVQMRPGGVSGLPDVAYNVAGLDFLAFAQLPRKF